jgi:mRNA interferase RelE/StbE
MEVIITKSYIKDLKFLPKDVRAAADAILDSLAASPSLQESGLDYKKLSGQKKTDNYYRIRSGNYRIGCELIQPTIIIITIFSRQDDYKSFA